MDWNVVVTVRAGPGHEHAVLQGLKALGEFHATAFKYVCLGRVEDSCAFLDEVLTAQESAQPWVAHLARVVPVERVFVCRPEDFVQSFKAAVTPFAARMGDGRFFVRVERRGQLGRIHTQEAERAAADHLIELVAARGGRLTTDFRDPDWIVACETLGGEAGVALLDRPLRERYPFLQVH
ncbi:MAG: THUMP domain-containing protein [Thiobacillaceae bacterium]|nr:THUMP domain-containing protein [Thiobacillaceae bacterium]MCX7672588.1 THUMP domain-containing protein [Thiobacillaceae bacterium]MDW8322528.1 THUMP domain-containing protein [Burkholderiales bacterium]